MNGFLKQSTASQVRTIGPFVDDTDFKTLENALTIANTDILLKKNGAASAAKNSGGATADGSGGMYHLTFDATDTATVGELFFSVKVAGALVVFGTYHVLEEAIFDALFNGSANGFAGAAGSSTVAFSNTTIATVTNLTNLPTIPANWLTAAGTAADFGTEVGTAVWANGTRTLTSLAGLTVDTVTTLTNLPTIPANWLTAAGTAADFGTEIGTAVWANGTRTLTSLSGLTVDTVTTLTNLPAITANWLTAAGTAADFGTEVGTAVWATTTRVLTAGTNINGSTFTEIPWNSAWNTEVFTQVEGAIIATFDFVGQEPRVLVNDISAAAKALIQTEVQDAIEANHLDHLLAVDYDPASKPGVATALLNELIGSDAGVSQFTANALELGPGGGSAPTAAQIADAVWDETLSSHVSAGSTGEFLTDLPAAVDAQLSGAHGAGAWGAGAGSGAFPITVTVNDGAAALQNVTVGVYDGATLSASGTTNISGQVTFSLDAATYTVALVKPGYTFTTASRTVTGNQTGTLTTALSMTASAIAAPSSPANCTVAGFIKDLQGNALPGAVLKARLVPPIANRPITANGNVVAFVSDEAIADVNGLVTFELIRTDAIDQDGCTYTFTCTAAELDESNVVLEAATLDLSTL